MKNIFCSLALMLLLVSCTSGTEGEKTVVKKFPTGRYMVEYMVYTVGTSTDNDILYNFAGVGYVSLSRNYFMLVDEYMTGENEYLMIFDNLEFEYKETLGYWESFFSNENEYGEITLKDNEDNILVVYSGYERNLMKQVFFKMYLSKR